MKKLFITGILINLLAVCVLAQSTEFTYQGRLLDNSLPPTANYDFEFLLFDSLVAGTQQGTTQTVTGVAVANGIFTVKLNFGAQFTGAARFIEIHVRPAGGGAYTTLAPRQAITSGPYAIRSLNSTTSDTATNALNLGGVGAGQFVVTTDPRMNDDRNPLPNSTNYIQNQNAAPQTSSNFNISGTGTANVFSAGTQFNIGSGRILSVFGTSPNQGLSVGLNAGTAGSINSFFGNKAGVNTTGGQNSFFGHSAGEFTTTGTNNSFFGVTAGRNTTTLSDNSYFGTNAGNFNTGSGNSYFGSGAGSGNTNGSENAFFGLVAGSTIFTGNNLSLFGARAFASNNLTNASAIGFRAMVTQNNSLVLGSINGVNGATADTNVGIGTTAPTERLQVVGNQSISGNLAVGGTINGTVTNATNAVTANNALNLGGIPAAQYALLSALNNLDAGNITSGTLSNARLGLIPTANGGTGLATPGASGNFLRSNGSVWTSSGLQASDIPSGNASYIQNTTTQQSSSNFNISGTGTAGAFDSASQYNIGGFRVLTAAGGIVQNTFAGVSAGNSNPSGGSNSFFGFNAGAAVTSGNSNAFFGALAGQNATGSSNAFFGTNAGRSTGGSGNAFFGQNAGLLNVNGSDSTFIGRDAGRTNTDGFDNTFVGKSAGDGNNISGNRITLLGASTDTLSDGLTNATAIGSRAAIGQSNSLVLGSISGVNFCSSPCTTVKVGIGTTTPAERLHVVGNSVVIGNVGIGIVAPQDALHVVGLVRLSNLGAAGTTPLCLNGLTQISSCSAPFADPTEVAAQKAQLEVQQKIIERQQKEIDALKRLVCAQNPTAEVCREVK